MNKVGKWVKLTQKIVEWPIIVHRVTVFVFSKRL